MNNNKYINVKKVIFMDDECDVHLPQDLYVKKTIYGRTEDLTDDSNKMASTEWVRRYTANLSTSTPGIVTEADPIWASDKYLYYTKQEADVRYLQSFTELDPTVPAHVKAITTTDITNWDTAYTWGNHALAGYITLAEARAGISLTTTGSSGAATYNNTTGVFNIPVYDFTADNGLTKTGVNTQLGGTLLGETLINNGAYSLTLTGTKASTLSGVLDVKNTSASANAIALFVDNASTNGNASALRVNSPNGAAGIVSISASAVAVSGTTTTANAGRFQSASGAGVEGISTTGKAGSFSILPASSTGILPVMSLTRFATVSPTAGIGGSIEFNLSNTSTGSLAGSLAFVSTDANFATRTSQFEVRTVNNAGTNTRRFYVTGPGYLGIDTVPLNDDALTQVLVRDNITGIVKYRNISSIVSTETDPVFTASPAFGITGTNISNWDLAYSWGDHALEGYLTSYTETDPVWTAEKANYALKTYVDTGIANLVDSAPGTLDTLNELAAALGDDPNFATTLTALIGTKEAAITAGTTLQYWRGDKTWQTLPVYTLSGLGGEPAIEAGTTAQYWRGDKTWQTLPTYTLPTATATVLGGIKIGSGLSIDANGVVSAAGGATYTLPTASDTVLGGIKVGTNLTIDANGVLSATDTNTTYAVFTRTVAGLVPNPGGSGTTRYLREDGTWVTPPDTDTDTNTTYTAGAGLTLAGTVFSVTKSITTAATADTIALRDASGYINAVAFFETSDIRFKNVLETNPIVPVADIEVIKFILNGHKKVRYGYSAQQVKQYIPEAVQGSDYLTVNYSDVHTLKIAALERKVAELETKLNSLTNA